MPSLAVALALEGKASHRELTSRLLSDLVGHVVTPEDIAWAFDKMLRDLPDLILDTPEAPQVSADVGTGWGRAGAGDTAVPGDALRGRGHAGGMLGGATATPGRAVAVLGDARRL